ncbi:hypothetical protein [Siphonobacter aquaeclarae]|uniref:Uncharacterized protein n=1 Tax=Siphonobacter aquaeclarae TaxID=563176 RepID=A0A1G9HXI8_9BACT|nr:hypothetical protein [Siphonobacter aquaeclarae]SDL17516.1 hypothetical protein SAMN04488090_0246 [Siphonobacter aquaeclarae]
MKVLSKVVEPCLPFRWFDSDGYRNSDAFRKEIYLKEEIDLQEHLVILFYNLFGKNKSDLIISNKYWGAFCLDTWDLNSEDLNVELKEKSETSRSYLKMLVDSGIGYEYKGLCVCNDWGRFLSVILSCVLNHEAPYSPLFYNLNEQFLFYFHHTGSIGLYYRKENDVIKDIFHCAKGNDYLMID